MAAGVEAVDDPVEARAARSVMVPEGAPRLELAEIAHAVLGRLRHRPLAGAEARVRRRGGDPEALRRLFEDEPGRLRRRERAEEEARGEPDGARRRRDEVGEVGEPRQIGEPSLRGQDGGERALTADEGRPVRLEPLAEPGGPGIDRTPRFIDGEQPPHEIRKEILMAADRRINAAGNTELIVRYDLLVERFTHPMQALKFEGIAWSF